MSSPTIIITGNLENIFGVLYPNDKIIFSLENYGLNVPRVSGTGFLVETVQSVTANGSGAFSTALWGNDVITPSGTYYLVTFVSDAGLQIAQIPYILNGTGTFDLSAVAPMISTPNPYLPNYIVSNPPSSAVQTIYGSLVVTGGITSDVPFSSILSGTSTATMYVGSLGSLSASGSGSIIATSAPYAGLTGTVPTWNQSTTGTASNISTTGIPNYVYATNTSGVTAAVPTLRALVAADLPSSITSNTSGNATTATSATTAGNLSGTPALPNGTTATTQSVNNNTTDLATTAFVLGQAGTSNPVMDGSVAVGVSTLYSRQDHVHASDTSRAPLANPTFTGTLAAPTINASSILQIGGANINTIYAPIANPTFTGIVTTPTINVTSAIEISGGVGTNGQILTSNGTTTSWAAPASGGNVIGPASSVSGNIASFNNTIGTLLEDSGLSLASVNGFRNRLINGNFVINQRVYVSGTATSAGVYMHDRWKAGAGGGTYTFTQTKGDTTITITAGTIQQVIEDLNLPEGGTYTLSWAGTAQGRVGAGSYAASPITVTGLTAATSATVEFNAGTLGKTQFEVGSVATPFERRDYGRELVMCQRYYQKLGGSVVYDILVAGYNETGTNLTTNLSLPVTMRTSPTAVVVGTWGASNCSQPNVAGAGTSTIGMTTVVTVSNPAQWWTTGTSTYVTLSAEL
jgi:hypothetical protein